MLQTLGLFLILPVVPLHCKLILSTNASKPVQHWRSYAKILNSSLQSVDNFTLCARYCLLIWNKNPVDFILNKHHALRFLTFNFTFGQYMFYYHPMDLLGNPPSTILTSSSKAQQIIWDKQLRSLPSTPTHPPSLTTTTHPLRTFFCIYRISGILRGNAH